MDDERLISILCVQQWEKCKGELMALAALQGSRLTKYAGNKVIINQEWEQLLKHVNDLIKEVEDNELHC
jgi:hypothetical protein